MAKKKPVAKKQAPVEVRIKWTDAEWTEVVVSTFRDRLTNPTKPFADCIADATAEWADDRKRGTSAAVELARRLAVYGESMRDAFEEIPKLNERIRQLEREAAERPTEEQLRDQIIANLTPADLGDKFPVNVVLDAVPTAVLIGAAAARQFEAEESRFLRLASRTPAANLTHEINHRNGAHLNIALVGFRLEQFTVLKLAFKARARCFHLDDAARFGPPDCDLIVVHNRRYPNREIKEWAESERAKGTPILDTSKNIADIKREIDAYLPVGV